MQARHSPNRYLNRKEKDVFEYYCWIYSCVVIFVNSNISSIMGEIGSVSSFPAENSEDAERKNQTVTKLNKQRYYFVLKHMI